MSEPLVSIIIPVFNGGDYLREAIDSAIAQTYSNTEVIVVNDGSNDHGATETIAKSYGDKIRYYYKKNGGVATALNLAIQEMKGEYFSWLSHDDIYYPTKIESQIQALRNNGDMTTIVYSDYDFLNVESQTITHVQHSRTFSIEKLTSSVFPVLQGLVHGCEFLIHKSHFERVGVFNANLISTQDYDLWFRMLRYQKIIHIAEPLVLARLHNAQGSRTLIGHNLQREQLHIDFLRAMTEEEVCNMYGSAYNYYYRMSCLFKGAKMNNAYRYANRKLQKADIPEKLLEQLEKLENYISDISKGKADRLCIFCAGEYGIRLYQELRSKLIIVDSFSDNNSEKWGQLYESVTCESPKQLNKEKERTLVIVATISPDEIVNQLELQGYPYITTKQEIDRVIFDIPPVKWVSALDDIEGLEISFTDASLLKSKFNQTIFDVCKYYSAKVKSVQMSDLNKS